MAAEVITSSVGARLKVAYFAGPYPYYSETFVFHQLRVLIAAGHDVQVFAESISEGSSSHAHVAPDRVEAMPKSPAARLAGLALGLTRGQIKLSRPLLRSANFFRYGLDALSLRLAWSVWRAGNNTGSDIIYAHFGPRGRRAALLRATGALQGKLVTVMHGEDISGYPRRFRGEIYAPLFASGDLFLAVSEYGKRKMLALGCPADRILVHRMGVDTTRFTPVARPATGLRILTVARLVAYKGLSTALDAVARLKLPFQYEIIGDGPLKTALVEQAEHLGLASQVSFLGARSGSFVLEALRAANVFFLPSETQANGAEEGIPVAIMEAMACGLPVVSTRHAGIPELIDAGVEGFLPAERDSAALAAAIETLARSPELRETMGQAGRKKILRNYDSAILDKELLLVLEGLV